MTDQTQVPETDPVDEVPPADEIASEAPVEAADPIEPEFVADEEEPEIVEEDIVEAEIVEAVDAPEQVQAVDLDLGSDGPQAVTGTDFDVVAEPHLATTAPIENLDLAEPQTAAEPAVSGPGPTAPEPTALEPTAPEPIGPEQTVVEPAVPESPTPQPTPQTTVPEPTVPETPVPSAPATAGGSFLDLPPLPDLNYPAPTPPPASPYPPPAQSYPQASNYPQTEYAPYPADYSEQVAGQAYGHGTPSPAPTPRPAPVSPYGTPTGFAVQPYQQVVPGDTTLASLAHWGGLVATMLTGSSLGFLVPLILMLTKGQNDPLVRANAVESLNFSLTVLLGMLASFVLLFVFVGVVGLIVIPIVAIILQILGAIAASRGEVYRYPVSIRFVK